MFKLFNEDTLRVDGGQELTVSRAGDSNGNRQRSTVARKTNNTNVVAEVLTAELRTKTNGFGQFEDLLFELEVTEALPLLATFGGKRVEIVGGG